MSVPVIDEKHFEFIDYAFGLENIPDEDDMPLFSYIPLVVFLAFGIVLVVVGLWL